MCYCEQGKHDGGSTLDANDERGPFLFEETNTEDETEGFVQRLVFMGLCMERSVEELSRFVFFFITFCLSRLL